MKYVEFETLLGKTLKSINVNDAEDQIDFKLEDGTTYSMLHTQDCCENVNLEEIIGDINDLIGSPLLMAEEIVSEEPDDATKELRQKAIASGEYYYEPESETWTFYKLATIRGSVTLRWYGTSNGWYSESVYLYENYGRQDEY